MISATEHDDMTGLYNRNFFLQYADRMYREHPEAPMDAIVLNIEQFHSVNALNGRAFGDQVLRALGREIHAVAEEAGGIAGRFEADRFDIYCRHPQDYQAIYDRLQGKLDELAHNASLRLRMGVMAWQAKLEPVQMFDRARTACTMARGHYHKHLIVFDEMGRLTSTFKRLADHMKEHINDLNKRVYVDALTSVKNKGAFSTAIDALQKQADDAGEETAFAIGVFECDDLKYVNDHYGHDKGDIYLKTACQLICRIFDHSPVFRIGGDEFAVILRNQDYENREQLVSQFEKERDRINADNENEWKQVHIAMGIAVFDPKTDSYVIDTVRRADKVMYADKQARKQTRK